MALDNDTRGWVMAGVSGVACVFGACIICVDLLVRQFPGKKNFSIQDSDVFLSSSLSLSFGVMLFSALYNMLPEGKISLMDGGLSASKASWILILCFLGGVIGIQLLSRAFHHFIPSHVVGCEHTHGDEEEAREPTHGGHKHHSPPRAGSHEHASNHKSHGHGESETRLSDDRELPKPLSETDPLLGASKRPPPLKNRVSSFLTGAKTICDARGPCYGYSDPCGKECFKIKASKPSLNNLRRSTFAATIHEPMVEAADGHVTEGCVPESSCGSREPFHHNPRHHHDSDETSNTSTVADVQGSSPEHHDHHPHSHDAPSQHHHHVPQNAFLSIGLQTSFAIALHKLPEGFITYATNHANPELGFSIFIALFIHNITEGFALALPLYLAIQSRWKAVIIASILGGASQPLGAGIAALWFRVAGTEDVVTSDVVYGCMFAITSGIMTSVALQLFSESLGLTHSRTMCIIWAFIGMGILGISNALTA